MGVIMRTAKYPDLHRYKPEYNADGTERHIICDGARFHVTSYSFGPDGMKEHCSEPKCEINKHGNLWAAMADRLSPNAEAQAGPRSGTSAGTICWRTTMGMFDYVNCRAPLPDGGPAEEFQTKDTPAQQYLDLYEIREDGTLWHEDYDIAAGGYGGMGLYGMKLYSEELY